MYIMIYNILKHSDIMYLDIFVNNHQHQCLNKWFKQEFLYEIELILDSVVLGIQNKSLITGELGKKQDFSVFLFSGILSKDGFVSKSFDIPFVKSCIDIYRCFIIHHSDVKWAAKCFTWMTAWLFIQQFVQISNKEKNQRPA